MAGMKSPLLVVGLLVCGCAVAFADDASAPDKSGYTLFNPTPSGSLRPLRMESYDNVKDPTTVDAGHFQVDSALIDFFSADRQYEFLDPFTGSEARVDVSTREYFWRPRFTAGLLNNLDLEVMPTYSVTYSHVVERAPFMLGKIIDQRTTTSGFGPVIVESKLNLWGNDGGRTALSISPVLSLPTDRGNVLGGLEGAFAVRLPQNFYVKLESDVLEQRIAGNNYAEFFEGLSINKSVCSKVDAYASLTANVSSFSGMEWFGYAGFGAIYKVSRGFQLFGGINFGLTDNSFDFNPRAGIAWRL